MSDLVLSLGQMLAVAVIVGGVSVALWQIWVLANKLARNLDRDTAAAPAQSHVRTPERRPQSSLVVSSDGHARRGPQAR